MLGNNVHVYFCLELTLGLRNLPRKAFLFGALQVVAMGSPFAPRVADWGHVPSNCSMSHQCPTLLVLLIHPRGAT